MNYYYNGSVLIGMTNGSIYQRFSYDANGRVVAVDYSTDSGSTYTTYYYLRNAQGDIVKLIDGNGNTVVEYVYDSWGKKLSTTGTLAATLGANQPFRYRGCVYDEETGWYYLQSRYYDPTTGRFISADVYLSTGQGVLGHNAFAYCLNNPENSSDPSGCIPFKGFIAFFRELLESGGRGGPVFSHSSSLSSKGYIVSSGHSSSSGNNSGYSSGAGTGAGTTVGQGPTIAGGIAATASGRPDEETQGMRLQQQNSLDGDCFASGYRGSFQRFTGQSGEGMDAHHVFPQYYKSQFHDLDIDIDLPEHLSWVESHYHKSFSYDYNLEWKGFFDGNPTRNGAFGLARELAGKYGFCIWFDWR